MVVSITCLNWPALIVIIPALIIFVAIFNSFSSVYPEIKRLEAITRSPVYNLCNEIVDGLTCIRAFN